MRIVRMFAILLIVALGGGLFGAGIGGLIGYGFPRSISGQVALDEGTDEPDTGKIETSKTRGLTVGVGQDDDTTTAKKGAALGAAFGLSIGFMLGLLLALLDQFMTQVIEWMDKRKSKSQLTQS